MYRLLFSLSPTIAQSAVASGCTLIIARPLLCFPFCCIPVLKLVSGLRGGTNPPTSPAAPTSCSTTVPPSPSLPPRVYAFRYPARTSCVFLCWQEKGRHRRNPLTASTRSLLAVAVNERKANSMNLYHCSARQKQGNVALNRQRLCYTGS